MSFMRIPGRLLALALLLCLPVTAEAAKRQLSPRDIDDVQRAEAYLNGIGTLRARFLQVAPTGATAEGDAYLARPGRMRLDYDPPTQIQVIADGRFLIYYDKELEQTSYVGLDDTPAGILVRPEIRLDGSGDVAVTDVRRGEGVLAISMVQLRDPGAGEITLVFAERPFELKQWRVRDPQGQVTTVSLFQAQKDVRLDPKLFHFVDPNFRKPGQDTER